MAQSLQFSQVKVITMTDGVQTVPAGKVWKIEFASRDAIVTYIKRTAYISSGTTGCSGSFWNTYTTTTELVAGQGSIKVNGSFIITDPITTPIWLKAGSTLEAYNSITPAQPSTSTNYRYILNGADLCGPYTPAQVNFSGLVSVIEFTIVP
jgi:hypothetical protein